MLRDRILTTLARQPSSMALQTLRAELHDVSTAVVGNAVSDLYREGRIERTGHARYRLPAPKTRASSPVVSGDDWRQPVMAKLMAGR